MSVDFQILDQPHSAHTLYQANYLIKRFYASIKSPESQEIGGFPTAAGWRSWHCCSIKSDHQTRRVLMLLFNLDRNYLLALFKELMTTK